MEGDESRAGQDAFRGTVAESPPQFFDDLVFIFITARDSDVSAFAAHSDARVAIADPRRHTQTTAGAEHCLELGRTSQDILRRYADLPPTIELAPGARVHAVLLQDLAFTSPYQPHNR
jgi:type IV secretory pathway VirB10-like protein